MLAPRRRGRGPVDDLHLVVFQRLPHATLLAMDARWQPVWPEAYSPPRCVRIEQQVSTPGGRSGPTERYLALTVPRAARPHVRTGHGGHAVEDGGPRRHEPKGVPEEWRPYRAMS